MAFVGCMAMRTDGDADRPWSTKYFAKYRNRVENVHFAFYLISVRPPILESTNEFDSFVSRWFSISNGSFASGAHCIATGARSGGQASLKRGRSIACNVLNSKPPFFPSPSHFSLCLLARRALDSYRIARSSRFISKFRISISEFWFVFCFCVWFVVASVHLCCK